MHFSSVYHNLHVTLCYDFKEMICIHATFPGMPHSLPLIYLERPLAFEWPWPSLRLDWDFGLFLRAATFTLGVPKPQPFPLVPHPHPFFLSSWPAPYGWWGPLTFLRANAETDSILIKAKQNKKPIRWTFLRLMPTRKVKEVETEEHKG